MTYKCYTFVVNFSEIDMKTAYIFGHKNPDTDTICSAITYAYLKDKLGFPVLAVRLGEINKETEFVLNYFKFEAPLLIETVDADKYDAILVDHNEFKQSVNNIHELNITEVIDHHRIADFHTKNPIYFRVEPVGCTATILFQMFHDNAVAIPQNIAGIMLSAIISDTLLLKSPTCTPRDVEVANKLAEIAGVKLEDYGLAMLKAGADLGDKTEKELINMDAKPFFMGGENVMIAQVNTVDFNDIYTKQQNIETEINHLIEEKGLSLFLFVVTDIINNNSEVLALGKSRLFVEKAFNVSLNNNRALLKGVVSRKKQLVPLITKTFEEQVSI